MTELMKLRADAPEPDGDRLAPARERLTEAFREESAGRRPAAPAVPRPRRRVVLVAAAAAAAVTGGIVVSRLEDEPRQDSADGRRVLSAQASAEALELAAATVEKSAVTEPRPKQWVYEKSAIRVGGELRTGEEWTRWDGTGHAQLPGIPRGGDISDFDPNELQVWYGPNQEEKWAKEGYDDRSQRQFWRFLVTLPSDPGRMMRRIREEHAIGDIEGETQAQRDWREIEVLHRSVLIPPHVQAGLFRALAKIPGARVEKGVEDPLGRPAIAVAVNYAEPTPSGWQGKQQLFFDPRTYAYLGAIKRSAPPEPPKGMTTPPGEPAFDAAPMIGARAAWGVVDKPGARP
ncbi:CU044_5270 family protein [Streptomyces sp. NPDC001595]|uniref:CU044_5270 family protein n=1 Tax=Streptomyces sp. NPDC001532 TaxID=3154520 RepID=UPI003328C4E3